MVSVAVLGTGLMGLPMAKSKAILEGDFTPSFSVRNAEKDTRLIVEAGESAGGAA
ncbi:hypothetical protein ABZW11_29820 [Nonomuraea sp. NPDC004580]|uniref:hypothetical protein n=1 Tax=Nonomuraea sp. NPDC004580 TaxID=3154552 RepID=UPI0033B6A981